MRINALVQRIVVTDDRRRTAENLAKRWIQLTADEILRNPFVLIGTVDQLTEDLVAKSERWDISSYAIFGSSIDDFAPIVARLAGK